MSLVTSEPDRCPDCGAPLTSEPWAAGLCPSCLLGLGLTDRADLPAAGEAEAPLPTGRVTTPSLSSGQVLGNRYRLRARLGVGGMGEVFHAFDLKLQVDVALKAVHPALLADGRALTALRQEVRAAREVVSPNVCRVFDLVEIDGRELVSMEYVDGTTLADVLRERSPLSLQEASEVASQLLAGLEAIHVAGLVHRDIKPENVMVTRSGRVVVMDFGIARAVSPVRAETISGTPAYMAPEQARGEAVDLRADLFSAAIVLAEMVAPDGVRDRQRREAVWQGVKATPPSVGKTPWAAVLGRAVLPVAAERYPTASALARALEEVTLRTSGDEGLRPYPGLAAFTERDAGYFVGRELEIEGMWKKLERAHLIALMGPSGAGKSSFLRAGLAHTAPHGWRVVIAAPRDRPFAALAQALAPELSGDVEAVARLIDFEQPATAVEVVGRWRRRHVQALLILDQFEELFTQSPPDVQERFVQLLGRLALDADVHVLLSMRDDFLFHCHRFESLAPIFSHLTAIGPPTGAALRRALVQPALKCGYRFEHEAVVEEMLAQVAGERGALPLVAFAMSRLWDTRDRERGLLTRAAYDEIGGVAGALAQHAEATLERIGQDRVPLVRELFRNLVTGQGTRATLGREELLSVFADGTSRDAASVSASRRQQAGDVLDALIDARLLTAYEVQSADTTTGDRRVEIVHESLLTAWPRLVRWQTQDQDGAQLRDQLRQAARLWEQRGKPDDLLWTGTSFREFELWRERYPGTLSAAEETFTSAMTARALRRRRQRHAALAAVVTTAILMATAMGVLWRRSEGARGQAVAAARQAEAQQLYALGQVELEQNPGAALAHALASLERADTPHVRLFALRALWQGPVPFVLSAVQSAVGTSSLSFSRDNTWLAAVNQVDGTVRLWTSDGSARREIPGVRTPGNFAWGDFSADSRSVVVTRSDSLRIYSVSTGEEVQRIDGAFRWGMVRGPRLITGSFAEPTPDGRMRRLIRIWPLDGSSPQPTSQVVTGPRGAGGTFDLDPSGTSMLSVYGERLYETSLNGVGRPEQQIVVPGSVRSFVVASDGTRIFTWDDQGRGHAWSRGSGTPLPAPRLDQPAGTSAAVASSSDARWLAATNGAPEVQVWDLDGPVDADPLVLQTGDQAPRVAFDAGNSWVATQGRRWLALWPLASNHPFVLRGPEKGFRDVIFDPRGQWIAAGGVPQGQLCIWPMHARGVADRVTIDLPAPILNLEASPRGDVIAVATLREGVWLVPIDGRQPERLQGFNGIVAALAFDNDGQRLAAGGGLGGELTSRGEAVVKIWDLGTRGVQVLDAGDNSMISGVAFTSDGHLLSTGPAGLRLWDIEAKTWTLLHEGVANASGSPDGRYILGLRGALRPGGIVGTAFVHDLQQGRSRDLATHGTEITSVAWHPSGTVVATGSRDGTLRIGPFTGEEPHLLFGHDAFVSGLAIEPGGRRIASAADDGTVRVWPMPEGQPLHTLPREVLLERLRSLTNLRVVEDASSPNGYRLGFEPAPGWNRKPPRW